MEEDETLSDTEGFVWVDEEVLHDFGLENLPPEKKKEFLQALEERVFNIVLLTTLKNLNDYQLRLVERALRYDEYVEPLLASIISKVPGLAEKIDYNIQREYEMIRREIAGEVEK